MNPEGESDQLRKDLLKDLQRRMSAGIGRDDVTVKTLIIYLFI